MAKKSILKSAKDVLGSKDKAAEESINDISQKEVEEELERLKADIQSYYLEHPQQDPALPDRIFVKDMNELEEKITEHIPKKVVEDEIIIKNEIEQAGPGTGSGLNPVDFSRVREFDLPENYLNELFVPDSKVVDEEQEMKKQVTKNEDEKELFSQGKYEYVSKSKHSGSAVKEQGKEAEKQRGESDGSNTEGTGLSEEYSQFVDELFNESFSNQEGMQPEEEFVNQIYAGGTEIEDDGSGESTDSNSRNDKMPGKIGKNDSKIKADKIDAQDEDIQDILKELFYEGKLKEDVHLDDTGAGHAGGDGQDDKGSQDNSSGANADKEAGTDKGADGISENSKEDDKGEHQGDESQEEFEKLLKNALKEEPVQEEQHSDIEMINKIFIAGQNSDQDGESENKQNGGSGGKKKEKRDQSNRPKGVKEVKEKIEIKRYESKEPEQQEEEVVEIKIPDWIHKTEKVEKKVSKEVSQVTETADSAVGDKDSEDVASKEVKLSDNEKTNAKIQEENTPEADNGKEAAEVKAEGQGNADPDGSAPAKSESDALKELFTIGEGAGTSDIGISSAKEASVVVKKEEAVAEAKAADKGNVAVTANEDAASEADIAEEKPGGGEEESDNSKEISGNGEGESGNDENASDSKKPNEITDIKQDEKANVEISEDDPQNLELNVKEKELVVEKEKVAVPIAVMQEPEIIKEEVIKPEKVVAEEKQVEIPVKVPAKSAEVDVLGLNLNPGEKPRPVAEINEDDKKVLPVGEKGKTVKQEAVKAEDVKQLETVAEKAVSEPDESVPESSEAVAEPGKVVSEQDTVLSDADKTMPQVKMAKDNPDDDIMKMLEQQLEVHTESQNDELRLSEDFNSDSNSSKKKGRKRKKAEQKRELLRNDQADQTVNISEPVKNNGQLISSGADRTELTIYRKEEKQGFFQGLLNKLKNLFKPKAKKDKTKPELIKSEPEKADLNTELTTADQAGDMTPVQMDEKHKIKVEGIINGSVQSEDIIVSPQAIVKQNVEANGQVICMEHATIMGNVTGNVVIVEGIIRGDVHAHEQVIVKNGGLVAGDIHSKKVHIDEQAILHGSIYR